MKTLAHLKLGELREQLDQSILSQARNIIGFNNYLIFPDGKVIGPRGHYLKPDPNSTGYLRVTLSKRGETTRRFIHQLVAEHFVEGRERGLVVHHIDGDNTNNHKDNLEWTTMSENVKDGWRRGRDTSHLHLNLPYFREGATTIPKGSTSQVIGEGSAEHTIV